jgi:hypothetical protein
MSHAAKLRLFANSNRHTLAAQGKTLIVGQNTTHAKQHHET